MKPVGVPAVAQQASQRVEFQVKFAGGPKSKGPSAHKGAAAPAPVEKASLDRLPKITRLLVLGHRFESMVREGVVKDYAEIARLTGLSRARVTQITNLTLLAPQIQGKILAISPGSGDIQITEHLARALASELNWRKQLSLGVPFTTPTFSVLTTSTPDRITT